MDIFAIMYLFNVNEVMNWELDTSTQSDIAWIMRPSKPVNPEEETGNWCQHDGTKTRCGYKNVTLCKFNNWATWEFPCRRKSSIR